MLWNTGGKQLRVLRGHCGGVLDARFSADGKNILTRGADGTARLWVEDCGSSIPIC